jgi:hypothetical protein
MSYHKLYPDLTGRSAAILNKLVKFSLADKQLHPDCGAVLIYNLFRGNYNFSYDNYQEILTWLSKNDYIFTIDARNHDKNHVA